MSISSPCFDPPPAGQSSQIGEFGYPGAASERFCTALFAQALSLSEKFAGSLLVKLGFPAPKRLVHVECERAIQNQSRIPDLWLTIGDLNSSVQKPDLALIECKIVSGETNSQLADYARYVADINAGLIDQYGSAKLVLLSTFKDMKTSIEPDIRISWNEVLEVAERLPERDPFETAYFSQVCQHLRAVCAIPAPAGDSGEYEKMMWDLAENRPWLIFRRTKRQAALWVDEQDFWISKRRSNFSRLGQLFIVDLSPPKLNGITEKWLFEWIDDKELLENLVGEARRNGTNVRFLEKNLQSILGLVDLHRSSAT